MDDKKCKVEPLMRSMKESDTDSWINGRRRDHGAERASLPVWEGNKVNPLAHWTFEECWNYLRKYEVPYHPLHDVGFSSPRRAVDQEGAPRDLVHLRRRA